VCTISPPSSPSEEEKITYGSFTTPELWSAYYEGVNPKSYANFLTLTDGGDKQCLAYKNGELYINAEFINTGTLTISDATSSTKPIFIADCDNGYVEIAGWKATKNGLVDPDEKVKMLSKDGTYLPSLLGGESQAIFEIGSEKDISNLLTHTESI
jgi:hypothetical protein